MASATSNYGFPYPLVSDPFDVYGDIKDLAEALDSAISGIGEISQDSAALMITSASHSGGISATYNDSTNKLSFALAQNISTSASPTFQSLTIVGPATAETAPDGTDSNQIATTAFVMNQGLVTGSSVSATYLTKAAASATYLAQADAASTYLTQSNAAIDYLTQASASSNYLTQSSASTIYLAQADANEVAVDAVAAAIAAGTHENITITYDDVGNSLSFVGSAASSLPSQTGNNAKVLVTDGTNSSWSFLNNTGNANPTMDMYVSIASSASAASSIIEYPAGASSASVSSASCFNVSDGNSYTITINAFTPDVFTVTPTIFWRDSSGTLISSASLTPTTGFTMSDYYEAWSGVTAPAGAAKASIQFECVAFDGISTKTMHFSSISIFDDTAIAMVLNSVAPNLSFVQESSTSSHFTWNASLGTYGIPDILGEAGKVLKTDGLATFWDMPLPTQTGNSGLFLATNGAVASWQNPRIKNYSYAELYASTSASTTSDFYLRLGADAAETSASTYLIPVSSSNDYSINFSSTFDQYMQMVPRAYWRNSSGSVISYTDFAAKTIAPNATTFYYSEAVVPPVGAENATFEIKFSFMYLANSMSMTAGFEHIAIAENGSTIEFWDWKTTTVADWVTFDSGSWDFLTLSSLNTTDELPFALSQNGMVIKSDGYSAYYDYPDYGEHVKSYEFMTASQSAIYTDYLSSLTPDSSGHKISAILSVSASCDLYMVLRDTVPTDISADYDYAGMVIASNDVGLTQEIRGTAASAVLLCSGVPANRKITISIDASNVVLAEPTFGYWKANTGYGASGVADYSGSWSNSQSIESRSIKIFTSNGATLTGRVSIFSSKPFEFF